MTDEENEDARGENKENRRARLARRYSGTEEREKRIKLPQKGRNRKWSYNEEDYDELH